VADMAGYSPFRASRISHLPLLGPRKCRDTICPVLDSALPRFPNSHFLGFFRKFRPCVLDNPSRKTFSLSPSALCTYARPLGVSWQKEKGPVSP
jgi:hypothetical protein